MMSISPLYGHGRPVRKSAPIIQNAGHRPLPLGTLIRASTRPYWKVNLLPVFIRCEVYSPAAGGPPGGPRCTRCPAPSMLALLLLRVVLQLVVLAGARVDRPLRRVGLGAGGAVELVAEDQPGGRERRVGRHAPAAWSGCRRCRRPGTPTASSRRRWTACGAVHPHVAAGAVDGERLLEARAGGGASRWSSRCRRRRRPGSGTRVAYAGSHCSTTWLICGGGAQVDVDPARVDPAGGARWSPSGWPGRCRTPWPAVQPKQVPSFWLVEATPACCRTAAVVRPVAGVGGRVVGGGVGDVAGAGRPYAPGTPTASSRTAVARAVP